jgi:Flp pilus assembly protein TadD
LTNALQRALRARGQSFASARKSVRMRVARVFVATAACLLLLTGCESWNKTVASFGSGQTGEASGAAPEPRAASAETTGSITAGAELAAAASSGPEDPNDDLNLGKRHFRESDYGLAERHFRHAVEKGPGEAHRDAEAWLGLAASYDRLRRFELADRAYARAIKILGPTAEILNNQGYSYLLRGDYRHARHKLLAARNLDPGNPYVQNNLELLAKSARR